MRLHLAGHARQDTDGGVYPTSDIQRRQQAGVIIRAAQQQWGFRLPGLFEKELLSIEQIQCLWKQSFARWREPKSAATGRPIYQDDSQDVLKLPELLGDRRLRAAQRVGSCRQASGPYHGDKGPH
jgi:hypothetical protein